MQRFRQLMLNATIGLAAVITFVFGSISFSIFLVGRFFPRFPLSVRLPAIGIIASAVSIIIFDALIFLDRFRIAIAWPVFLFLFFIGASFGKATIAETFRETVDWFRWLGSIRSRLMIFCAVLLPLVISGARALLMPPLSWDSQTYHLFFPALWVQQGGLFPKALPYPTDAYSHFPFTAESFAGWLMLFFHSDLLVNLMNFPFLFLGSLSLYACGREFGMDRENSLLTAALIAFSPMLYAELTTSYVEIVLYAFLVSSVLFFIRYLRHRDFADGVLMLLCMAVAFGTKLFSVISIAIIGILFLIVTILRGKNLPGRGIREISILLLILPVLMILSCAWYLRNFVERKNPFYPYRIQIAGWKTGPESKQMTTFFRTFGLGVPEQDYESFFTMFTYRPESYPITAGPKYFPLMIMAVILVFHKTDQCKRIEYAILMAFGFLPIFHTFVSNSPMLVALRRQWGEFVPRFLASQFAIIALAVLIKVENLIPKRLVKTVLLSLIFIDLLHLNLIFLDWDIGAGTVIALITLAGLCYYSVFVAITRTDRLWLVGFYTAVAFFLSAFVLSELGIYRHESRGRYYSKHVDYPGMDKQYAEAWAFFDRLSGDRIVYCVGEDGLGHKWFFYPLMGGNLQNEVFYIPTPKYSDNDSVTLSEEQTRRLLGQWIKDLESYNIDYVMIQEPWPLEKTLVPKSLAFEQVMRGDGFFIYKFHRHKMASLGLSEKS